MSKTEKKLKKIGITSDYMRSFKKQKRKKIRNTTLNEPIIEKIFNNAEMNF